jgi:hypothetical protein
LKSLQVKPMTQALYDQKNKFIMSDRELYLLVIQLY